jgi:hypothetical protein
VARDASLRTILVLEDDFVFDSDIMPDVLARQIDDAIKSLPRDWTRLQLGSLPIASVYYNEHADRAASTFAHAQIWSRAGIEYMASMEYTPNVYHDLSLALKLEHSYDIRPMVCYQRVLGSDNTPGLAERLFSNEDAMKTNVWLLPVIITLISISICIVWYSILLRYTSLGKLKSFGVATVCTVIPLGITLAIIIR